MGSSITPLSLTEYYDPHHGGGGESPEIWGVVSHPSTPLDIAINIAGVGVGQPWRYGEKYHPPLPSWILWSTSREGGHPCNMVSSITPLSCPGYYYPYPRRCPPPSSLPTPAIWGVISPLSPPLDIMIHIAGVVDTPTIWGVVSPLSPHLVKNHIVGGSISPAIWRVVSPPTHWILQSTSRGVNTPVIQGVVSPPLPAWILQSTS